MSLERDITTLKQILEDEQVFKPASRENLKQRQAALGALWMNIRVIRGNSEEEAVEAIQDGAFEEAHPLCDVVIPASDMKIKNAWLTNGGTSWVAADQITVNEAEGVFKAAGPSDLYKRHEDARNRDKAVTPEIKELAQRYWKTLNDIDYVLQDLREQYGLDDDSVCECALPDLISVPGDNGYTNNFCLKCGADAGSEANEPI